LNRNLALADAQATDWPPLFGSPTVREGRGL
jgi:hypothetical protein